MYVCVLDKWYFSTSYSEPEVDKAVTARAALYPDLDKWYFGASYSVLEADEAATARAALYPVIPMQVMSQCVYIIYLMMWWEVAASFAMAARKLSSHDFPQPGNPRVGKLACSRLDLPYSALPPNCAVDFGLKEHPKNHPYESHTVSE